MQKYLNPVKLLYIILLILSFQGCLHFNTASYSIKLEDASKGSVTVIVNDIKSDAINSAELNEDKKNLFDFALKSDDFIQQMQSEGKYITSRNLEVEEGKLNGIINYDFNNINDVEGIVYEEPFYYLTIETGDSVVSTNGKIIESKDYKRIIWDNSIKTLEFEMFSENTDGSNLTGMASYYNKE